MTATLRKFGLPTTRDGMGKRLTKFRDFLVAAGAEIVEPTNPYEVLRVRSIFGTAVLYVKESGVLTWTPEIAELWQAYRNNRPPQLTVKTKTGSRGGRKRTRHDIATISARDGMKCFYCGDPLDEDTATVEHLVARASGGPNHLANKFLACERDNMRAGHLSAPEKIRLRDELRRPKCGNG